jgi:hypothetical protein
VCDCWDFAKEQLALMLQGTFLHPAGQIPAYEWNSGRLPSFAELQLVGEPLGQTCYRGWNTRSRRSNVRSRICAQVATLSVAAK